MLPESSQFPVQVGLGTLLSNVPHFNPTVGTLAVQRPELALATLLAITPVLIVFLFSQRFLVAGMLAGATKELTRPRSTPHDAQHDRPTSGRRPAAHAPLPDEPPMPSALRDRRTLRMLPVITASVPLLEPPGWAWPSARCSTCSTTPGAASPATSPDRTAG